MFFSDSCISKRAKLEKEEKIINKEKMTIDRLIANVGKEMVSLSIKAATLSANSVCLFGFYEFEQPEGVMKLKKKNK